MSDKPSVTSTLVGEGQHPMNRRGDRKYDAASGKFLAELTQDLDSLHRDDSKHWHKEREIGKNEYNMRALLQQEAGKVEGILNNIKGTINNINNAIRSEGIKVESMKKRAEYHRKFKDIVLRKVKEGTASETEVLAMETNDEDDKELLPAIPIVEEQIKTIKENLKAHEENLRHHEEIYSFFAKAQPRIEFPPENAAERVNHMSKILAGPFVKISATAAAKLGQCAEAVLQAENATGKVEDAEMALGLMKAVDKACAEFIIELQRLAEQYSKPLVAANPMAQKFIEGAVGL